MLYYDFSDSRSNSTTTNSTSLHQFPDIYSDLTFTAIKNAHSKTWRFDDKPVMLPFTSPPTEHEDCDINFDLEGIFRCCPGSIDVINRGIRELDTGNDTFCWLLKDISKFPTRATPDGFVKTCQFRVKVKLVPRHGLVCACCDACRDMREMEEIFRLNAGRTGCGFRFSRSMAVRLG